MRECEGKPHAATMTVLSYKHKVKLQNNMVVIQASIINNTVLRPSGHAS